MPQCKGAERALLFWGIIKLVKKSVIRNKEKEDEKKE